LSSVQLSGVEVGFTAAQLLDQIMRGETPQTMEILLPPKGIVVRRSSDQFVIADRLVADAARLIRDFAPLGMNVNELCQRLNTSRSTLERRMGAVFKRSPKEEIQRVRFREVERLLSQTDNTIETIAAQTGFPHCHYLQSAFKSTYGITPGTFRKRAAQNP
jgi:LacI family transcriptional regulator